MLHMCKTDAYNIIPQKNELKQVKHDFGHDSLVTACGTIYRMCTKSIYNIRYVHVFLDAGFPGQV